MIIYPYWITYFQVHFIAIISKTISCLLEKEPKNHVKLLKSEQACQRKNVTCPGGRESELPHKTLQIDLVEKMEHSFIRVLA